MWKLSHAALAFVSGLIWFAVGMSLMPLGLSLLVNAGKIPGESIPLLSFFSLYFNRTEEAALMLIVIGLFIGYTKSKYVLSKTVRRTGDRIKSFPNPSSVMKLFSPAYLILIGIMISLGMAMRFFGIPNDIRGLIDVAVGVALINGAMLYFRMAWDLKRKGAKA